jgi:hypothetical protein
VFGFSDQQPTFQPAIFDDRGIGAALGFFKLALQRSNLAVTLGTTETMLLKVPGHCSKRRRCCKRSKAWRVGDFAGKVNATRFNWAGVISETATGDWPGSSNHSLPVSRTA